MNLDLSNVNVKIFVEPSATTDIRTFINVFHRLIQDHKLDGILVDVAEYTHVANGPGVLLVAHEGHWVMDTTDGQLGLLYNQKRVPPAPAEDHLRRAFIQALKACTFIEVDPDIAGKLKFDAHRAQVIVNDRLAVPNTPESYAVFEPIVRNFLATLYKDAAVTVKQEGDPRKRCAVTAHAADPLQAAEALRRLSSQLTGTTTQG